MELIDKFENDSDEFFIQELVKNVDLSGVIFTRDLETNSPYYIINYDRSGKTNYVTSGKNDNSERIDTILRNSIKKIKNFFCYY